MKTWIMVAWIALVAGPVCFAESGSSMKDCESSLEVPSDLKLRIGALLTAGKRKLFALSPYAGSSHLEMIKRMADFAGDKNLRGRVLWMGEAYVRQRFGANLPQIRAANETSGTFKKGLKPDTDVFYTGLQIDYENDYTALTPALRSFDFEGWHFKDGPERMAPDLRPIKKDIRHEMPDALAKFTSMRRVILNPRNSLETRERFLSQVPETLSDDLAIINWLLLDLVGEGRLAAEDTSAILKMVRLLQTPTTRLEDFDQIDVKLLVAQSEHIAELARGINAPVEIYEIEK